jgi:protein-S-isoprenylcysteine O-methyltransferase Ste14
MIIAHYLIPALWIAWLLYWWATAYAVKKTRWREPSGQAFAYRVPFIVAVILLLGGVRGVPWLNARWIAPSDMISWIAILSVLLGLAFAIRARQYLGPNWSADVTVKVDHALVRTGPYRFVRHPIYSGLILAIAGSALEVGEWRAVIAIVLAIISLKYKSLLEEQKMRETFVEYDEYRRTTAALIPFVL